MTNERKRTSAARRACVLRRGCRKPRRRGVAMLVVLLLISATLGLSYAAVRSQYREAQIQRNSGRRISARVAAVTGMTMAIKRMHLGKEWGGADSAFSGKLNNYENFKVAYSTGDPSLTAGHSDYDDLPYRVTLLSTGFAADPDNPSSIATYRIQAVVRLIPRQLAAEPAAWDELTSYTLCQWKDGVFDVTVPTRIEGPVRIRKKLKFAEEYDGDDEIWERYLGDLNLMRLGSYPDLRPFSGPVYLPYGEQNGGMISFLNASMSITTNDASKENIDGWTFPGPWTSYRLYPGGKVYYSQTIAAYPQNVNLEPDPEINPLGIFHRPGTIQLSHNVKIQGTVVANGGGDVYITGRNVHLSPVDLPPLEGTSEPIQLPVLMPEDDFRIYPGAQGSVEGMLAMRDDFEIVSDEQYDINVPIEGRIVCRDLMIRGRTDWQRWDDNVWDMAWDWLENLEAILDPGEVFMMGMGDGRTVILAENDVVYFPVLVWGWLDLDPNPRLTIKPPSSPARYHWHDPNNPVYVPHPDDDGLRWDLLEWAENP